MGTKVIQLTTTGRKSGRPRTVMLNAFPADGNYAVVGSNAGDDAQPLWYLNLVNNPTATVDVSGTPYEVVARDAQGEERDRLWAEIVIADSAYAEYQERTERRIPVVILERQSAT